MSTTITRELQFDAGHRLMGHESKCAKLHGHRYRGLIQVWSPYLDEVGRVIDFGKVKEKVGGWIDEYWDHTMLLRRDDPLLRFPEAFEGQTIYTMDDNPTAENMARDLFRVSAALLEEDGLEVLSVRLYETPNCYADYSR